MKTIRTWIGRGIALAALAPYAALAQSSDGTFQNPGAKAGINSVQGFIAAFLKAIVQISLPILTLFIVYAGFRFVFARGNPGELEKAKSNFVYVIIGAILILGAWVLSTLIASTATQVLGTS